MARSKYGGKESPVDLSKLRLLEPEIVLTPREVEEGCTIVDVPLTDEERWRLHVMMHRTGLDLGGVVRDAMRLEDILSEERFVFGNDQLVQDGETGKIERLNLWPDLQTA